MSIFLKKSKDFPWIKTGHRTVPMVKKKYLIFGGVVVVLALVRILGVMFAHQKINDYLANFSPTYLFHISDLEVSIIRGAYRFEGIEGVLKRNGRRFADIESVDVSIAWRELVKGRILTDITINQMNFTYLKELTSSVKRRDQTDAQDAQRRLFPVRVEKLDLVDSKITLGEYAGLSPSKQLTASGIEGRMTNVTGTKKFPLTFYNLKANLLGTSVLITTGNLNLLSQPIEWDFNGEILNFDLTEANTFLKKKVPLTFTKGSVDIYSEAISTNGEMKGYVKPFFHGLDVISSKEKWDTPKRTFVEVFTALGNFLLKSGKKDTVATSVPFSYKDDFKVDSSEAVSKVLEQAFERQLSPGLENKYELKANN